MLVNHRKAAGTDITGFTIGFGQGKLTADSYILDVLLYVKSSSNTTSEETGQTSSSSSSLVVAKSSTSGSTSRGEVSWEPCAYEDSSGTGTGGRMEVIRVALRKYTVIIQLFMQIYG